MQFAVSHSSTFFSPFISDRQTLLLYCKVALCNDCWYTHVEADQCVSVLHAEKNGSYHAISIYMNASEPSEQDKHLLSEFLKPISSIYYQNHSLLEIIGSPIRTITSNTHFGMERTASPSPNFNPISFFLTFLKSWVCTRKPKSLDEILSRRVVKYPARIMPKASWCLPKSSDLQHVKRHLTKY